MRSKCKSSPFGQGKFWTWGSHCCLLPPHLLKKYWTVLSRAHHFGKHCYKWRECVYKFTAYVAVYDMQFLNFAIYCWDKKYTCARTAHGTKAERVTAKKEGRGSRAVSIVCICSSCPHTYIVSGERFFFPCRFSLYNPFIPLCPFIHWPIFY